MMDSPEARPLSEAPWLFGKQGLGLLAFITAVAATFLATDVTYLAGVLLLAGLTARAWAALAFVRITYQRKVSRDRAFCGDELTLESVLNNPRILPLPWAEVWEQLPAALQPEAPRERSYAEADRVWVNRGAAVWPYHRLRWRRKLHCAHRGVFRLGITRIRTGDPFGFFEREHIYRDSVEVLVYPRVVPLRGLGLPFHHASLDVASRRSHITDPTRTATIREYQPDDSRRLIHWPSTARRGSLQVRVLEPATSLHVSLVLDVRGFSFGIYREELLELTLSALASMAVFLQSKGSPTAFVANTHVPTIIPAGASVPHLQSVLESLARLTPSAGPNIVPWALDHLPRGDTIVLATSDVSPDLRACLEQVPDAGRHAILMLAGTDRVRTRLGGAGTIPILPGCDVAAVLEGRP
jgi:uncharacterized protein (DUF58 family)